MKFTESELQIMELFWNSEKPLASSDILKLSPADKMWKDNSIYHNSDSPAKGRNVHVVYCRDKVQHDAGFYVRYYEDFHCNRIICAP